MKTRKRLKIADVVIDLKSRFPLRDRRKKSKADLPFLLSHQIPRQSNAPFAHRTLRRGKAPLAHRIPRQGNAPQRFRTFFYRGTGKAEITITVDVVDKLPSVAGAQVVFIANHFQDGSENWRLLKKGRGYIYTSRIKKKQQVIFVNKAFNEAKAYLLPKTDGEYVWEVEAIIYDFLQVLLINYFALKRTGIFVHSIGVKDTDGRGLLFAGKSGAGKSTTARLWHKHTKATVLNDDRVVVRKQRGRFYIHGSPWHGDFGDYLDSRPGSAPLKRLFFIEHAAENNARKIGQGESFQHLYPSLFPPFWDKTCLENTVSMSAQLLKDVSCYRMGFVNDKKVIGFVRKI